MGIVRVELTCSECGRTFTKEKDCEPDRAASWRDWTRKNVTLCGSCYYKLMHPGEERPSQPLVADVILEPDAETSPSYAPVFIIFSGGTYDKKDAIKELGGRWNGDESRFDFVPNKRWYIRTTPAELDDLAAKVAGMGADIRSYPDEGSLEIAGAIVETIPKPVQYTSGSLSFDDDIKALWPDESSKWNGRFYGADGNRYIYIGGQRVNVTDDQKERMESTIAAGTVQTGEDLPFE